MLLRGLGAVRAANRYGGRILRGYLVVKPFLDHRQRKRMDDFEKHLADGLDIMVGGLEAGSSITPRWNWSAARCQRRSRPNSLACFGMRAWECLTKKRSTACIERVPSDDVGMLVSAIGVQFRVGGNLASVLRTLTDTVRDRQKIRGDVKTLTAQQKMTGWLITGIPDLYGGSVARVKS